MHRPSVGSARGGSAAWQSRNIAIIGSGYVGLASAVCLADLGHSIIGVDLDADKVGALQQAVSPIYEVGMDELLATHRRTGRLRFTTSYERALADAEFAFICVGTPPRPDGTPDLSYVRAAVASIAKHLPADRVVTVVNKSTLPVGSVDDVHEWLLAGSPAGARFRVVSNPEFLREGRAVHDVFHPDRIVIGAHDLAAAEAVAGLYVGIDAPVLLTDPRSAELIKYASNAFLATKISFVNQLAELAERVGADVTVISAGMGLDPRIGPGHLWAGLGYGGSCLPKDVAGLASMARTADVAMPLLDAVQDINGRQRRRVVERLDALLDGLVGRRIGIWGLAFKEDTDDLREAPALDIVMLLQAAGVAEIRAYDPQAMGRAMPLLPGVMLCTDVYEAASGVDALILVTPWPDFLDVDLERIAATMRGRLVFDGRNYLRRDDVRRAGLVYAGIGTADIDAHVGTHLDGGEALGSGRGAGA